MALAALAQPAQETLLRAAEAALNRLLSADPESPRRLRPLVDCRLSVELTDIELNLLVLFSETEIRLRPAASDTDAEPEARVRSSLTALLGLASASGRRGAKVDLSGDVSVVQDVRRLFAELEVDWEEQLSRLTGDVLAHQVGRAARHSSSWFQRAAESMVYTLGEYLTEERREIPAAAEVSAFLTEVDGLYQDVERLAARLQRLEQTLERR